MEISGCAYQTLYEFSVMAEIHDSLTESAHSGHAKTIIGSQPLTMAKNVQGY